MDWTDVAAVEELSQLEFTEHIDSPEPLNVLEILSLMGGKVLFWPHPLQAET